MRVHDLLDHWAQRLPDEIYASDGERSLTWREMQEWSHRVGSWLARTLAPGDRFAMLDRNSLEYIAIYFGASRAGVVPVPLNFRLAPPEWGWIVEDAGCRTALVHADYAASLAAVAPQLALSVIDASATTQLGFAAEIAAASPAPVERGITPDAVFHQMYTSGTTGRPKGAMLTQRAVCENAWQIQVALDSNRKRTLCAMPMFHAGAELQVLSYTAGGCSIRVVRDYDQQTVMRLISDLGIQLLTLAPAMIQGMVADPLVAELDFSALELMVYGSAPMPVELLRRAMDAFSTEFAQAYGMTECGAVATILSPEDHRRALADRPGVLASAGRPVLGSAVAVASVDGTRLAVGEVGEILVRGEQLMTGYWQLPEATATALVDGWLRTGDAGHLDEEGYVFISDRVKDMIISGGENIYPREVEEVLFTLPGVADAAVYGIASERWGESPAAVVVLTPGATLTAEQVVAHCREHLAGYKCPVEVGFVDLLPRSALGKVLKRELRAAHR